MNINALKQACELKQEAAREETAWYKHILTISFGSLTVLVSLTPSIPDSLVARYLITGTWLFLGLGILFGIGATYESVNKLRRSGDAVAKSILEDQKHSVVGVKTHLFFTMCRILMLGFIGLALVCLVAFSITKTLLPNHRIEPIVTTPVESGNVQSTQAHP